MADLVRDARLAGLEMDFVTDVESHKRFSPLYPPVQSIRCRLLG